MLFDFCNCLLTLQIKQTLLANSDCYPPDRIQHITRVEDYTKDHVDLQCRFSTSRKRLEGNDSFQEGDYCDAPTQCIEGRSNAERLLLLDRTQVGRRRLVSVVLRDGREVL